MNKDEKPHWKNVLIREETSIMSAIKHMDTEALRVLLVVDAEQRLLGIITDGDIRRYILKHGNLENTVNHVMNKRPVTVTIAENQEQISSQYSRIGKVATFKPFFARFVKKCGMSQ